MQKDQIIDCKGPGFLDTRFNKAMYALKSGQGGT